MVLGRHGDGVRQGHPLITIWPAGDSRYMAFKVTFCGPEHVHVPHISEVTIGSADM
jgi:hypothetical protein